LIDARREEEMMEINVMGVEMLETNKKGDSES
jgi:hypothetical protein